MTTRHPLAALGLAGSLLLQLACATARPDERPAAAAPDASVLAHWSQFVAHPRTTVDSAPIKLVARFIVDGDGPGCGRFRLQPEPRHAEPPQPATTRSVAADPAFPITVCQFEMYAGWDRATLHREGDPTPLASFPGPHRVGRIHEGEVVAIGIGDTGCRTSDCDADQGVNRRFEEVVAKVLKTVPEPDLVLHVGDYRYYDENGPDSWANWQKDFFTPAQPLLDRAPVAFIRGNHEECDGDEGFWYGTRFFQFFEPTPSAEVASCEKGTASLMPTWAFDVGVRDGGKIAPWSRQRMVMIDDSPDEKNFSSAAWPGIVEQLVDRFETALELGASAGDVWWLSHKPMWNNPDEYPNPGTQIAVLEALGNQPGEPIDSTPCRGGSCNPRAMLAGHAHDFQLSVFDDGDWPIQLVLGHGGVRPLEGTDITGQAYAFSTPSPPFGESFEAHTTVVYDQNGFLKLTRSRKSLSTPSGWNVENCLLGEPCVEVGEAQPAAAAAASSSADASMQ